MNYKYFRDLTILSYNIYINISLVDKYEVVDSNFFIC